MPDSVRPVLQRLARRLAIGLFLDVWPPWAVACLLAAGVAALAVRLFFAGAAPIIPWLWLAPAAAAVPAAIVCIRRAYRLDQVVALADWLGGGRGLLLTAFERGDPAWTDSRLFADVTRIALPRVRPWRRLSVLLPALAFLAMAAMLPQRLPASGANAALADDIAADLSAAVVELKQNELITAAEEKKLEEEIERIRHGARERVDASSWEAADALKERVAAGLTGKQDALDWAEASLARYAESAAAGGGNAEATAEASAAELAKALEKLAQSGLLAGAPADLQRLLKGGALPTDAAAMRRLSAELAKYLAGVQGRLGNLAGAGKSFGRFDPSAFPLEGEGLAPGPGRPGEGAITRGRGDAPLTWGEESKPFDRFKAQPLPPGAARSPDDWAPLVSLPGAPQESATLSAAAAARQYAAGVGQAAWRRTLAPRHQSAVKKYFEK